MTTIQVPDMMCENCVKTAVSELEDLGFTPEVR